MSDFFTRLAERTLGLAPTIQPMIPSLFAPEPDVPGDMPLEITEESIATDIVSSNANSTVRAQDTTTYPVQQTSMPLPYEISQPFPAIASTTASQQQSALATMGELQAAQMSDHLTTRNETSVAGTDVHRMQQTRRGAQRNQPMRPAPVSSTQVQTPSFAPINAQTLGMARRTDEIPETAATFPTNSPADNPFTHNTRTTHISIVSSTGEQQMVQAQQEMQATISYGQIVSHHTLVGIPAPNLSARADFQRVQQTQQVQQMQKTSPEPDIRVTIGRIEVRAVTAPPKNVRPQPPADRPSAMSLDEYLRQQERGGRR